MRETANAQKHGYQEVKSTVNHLIVKKNCTESFAPGINKMGGSRLAREAFINVNEAHSYFAVEVDCISNKEIAPSLPCLNYESSSNIYEKSLSLEKKPVSKTPP